MMPTRFFVRYGGQKARPRPRRCDGCHTFCDSRGVRYALRVYPGWPQRMALKDEEREPDHGESDQRCCDGGRCEEQRIETFRRNPARHGILAG